MRKYLERMLRTTIVAATALLSGLPSAQAALYTGAWDPWFGVPFDSPPRLNWEGTFAVTADCPTSPLGSSGNLAQCAGGSATVSSLTLSLFLDGSSTAATINFGANSMSIGDLFWENPSSGSVISKLKTGLTTYAPAPMTADTALNDALSGYQFALQFFMNGSASGGSPIAVNDLLAAGYSGPVLFTYLQTGDTGGPVIRANVLGGIDYQPNFTGLILQSDQSVPEPGALALVAVALLAGGLAQRKRAAQH